MIKIILIGAAGKMGRIVAEAISNEKDMKIVAGVEKTGHPHIGSPFYDGYLTDDLEKVIKAGDICVDFTNPLATLENLEIARKEKKPYLTGTTGLTEEQLAIIKKISDEIPILYSPNFSFGINLLFKMIKEMVKFLPDDYDISLIETHHKKKVDAPSGTAKKFIEIIKNKKREKEIKPISLRLGDIIGEHVLIFATEGEYIKIIHHATSRFAFAKGVIYGIRFLINKEPNFYTFEDILLST
uniref:4-hydroxy-tetrahydrodipicolinate reductase n=1 Tax=candidate division WOR-3 bacterium TaxID=2052148 RepID=A0A7V6CNC2_UNCW3